VKIAILESNFDPFTNSVASKLSDYETEFLSLHEFRIPPLTTFRVVVDRLSYCNPFLRESLKALSLNGVYAINNKIIDICLCAKLGILTPKTIVLPIFVPGEELDGIVFEPFWTQVQDEVGFPCILKPFDGYAWQDVYIINSLDELKERYHKMMSSKVMLVQRLIKYKDYYRFFCINKHDVLPVRWNPKPFDLGEYLYSDLVELKGMIDKLSEMTIALNSILDLDINAVEWCLDNEGQPWIIDSSNDVPDIRPESFPREYYEWLVDNFARCIRDKAESNAQNRPFFPID